MMKKPGISEPRQLPIDFGRHAAFTRDDLAIANSNRAAFELLSCWPRWPSAVVAVAGPAGAGKSHLAAVWQVQSEARSFDAAAIGEPDLPPSGAALVEDADNGALDEQGLFHLINAVTASGGSLLLTGRSFPTGWNVALPDLASRLKTATTVEIGAPDDALLAAVITKLFSDRQVAVDKQVVNYLVTRMDRSLAAAINLVDRIDRASLEMKRPVTRTLAADVLVRADRSRSG